MRPPFKGFRPRGARGGRGGRAPRPPYHQVAHHFRAPGLRRDPVQCYQCGKWVTNLREHKERTHSQKKFGFECPVCGHFEGADQKNLMVKHIMAHPNLVIERCAKHVPEGYTTPVRCPVTECHHKARDQYQLGLHVAAAHRAVSGLNIESYHTLKQSARHVQGASVASPTFFPFQQVASPTPMMASLNITQASAGRAPMPTWAFSPVQPAALSTQPPAWIPACTATSGSAAAATMEERPRPVAPRSTSPPPPPPPMDRRSPVSGV